MYVGIINVKALLSTLKRIIYVGNAKMFHSPLKVHHVLDNMYRRRYISYYTQSLGKEGIQK